MYLQRALPAHSLEVIEGETGWRRYILRQRIPGRLGSGFELRVILDFVILPSGRQVCRL